MNRSPHDAKKFLRRLAVPLAMCALLAGCRNDPHRGNHIDVLTAELRTLEDQLYELEYDYERQALELEDAKEEIERLRGDSSRRREATRSRGVDEEEPFDLSPPPEEPGEPFMPDVDFLPEDLPAPTENGGGGGDPPPIEAPTLIQPADPRITHIHINPRRTGGANFDLKAGDDGITLVVEPRNAASEFVPLAGPISVVLLDYEKRGNDDEARLGRWDLDAQQVERSMTNNDLERGVHLQLAWADKKPVGSRLLVAVRYTTADGRKLEAQRDVFVTLPGQLSQRWTPRSSTQAAARGDDSINVARQPSETDGAALERRDPPAVVPASAERPTWRPYR